MHLADAAGELKRVEFSYVQATWKQVFYVFEILY